MGNRFWDLYESTRENVKNQIKSTCNGAARWLETTSKSLARSVKNGLKQFVDTDVKMQLKSTGDSLARWMDKDVLHVKGRTFQRGQVLFIVLLLGGSLAITVIILKRNKKAKPIKKQFMKGIASWTSNGIEGLRLTSELTVPERIPKNNVLVRVEAASVELVDVRILYGYGRRWMRRPGATVPGRDCSGIVVKVGPDVADFDIGDKVWAFSPPNQQGLLSEFVCLPTSRVSKMPDSVSFTEAASVPYSAILTWQALCVHAGISPTNTEGKRVLVHMGSSACGCLAIQLVKAWGGHVTATVPTPGLPMARLLGADDVIVFSVTDFQDELKTRDKFDVVINTVMGSALHGMCLQLCTQGGRVVSTANPFPETDSSGTPRKFPPVLHLAQTAWRTISQIFFTSPEVRQWKHFTFNKEILEHFRELIETGQLEPVVEEVFALKDGIQAFQRVANGDTVGKIVIKFK